MSLPDPPTKRHAHDRAGPWGNVDRRRSEPQADFWNPTWPYLPAAPAPIVDNDQ